MPGPLCKESGCKTEASYNFPNKTQRLYCNKHKKDEMINSRDTCNEKNCNTSPIYNYKNLYRLYCNKHKKDGMINVKHKYCIKDECFKRARYGLQNKYNDHCKHHKTDAMIDNNIKKCLECGLYQVHKRRQYLCGTCFRNKYPHHPKNKKIKQKEIFITKRISEDYPDIQFQFDKQISYQSCHKKRPDIFLDCYNYTIIIEIDENQHQYYSCENKRLMEIFESLGNRPLVCIRFNPDKYKNFNSIFTFTKNGFIKETKQFLERYTKLKKRFDYYLNNSPTKEITIENLYFDN